MSWLKRNWRRLLLIGITSAATLAGEHTIMREVAPIATGIVQSIPCTPGEPCSDAPPVKPQ